MKKTIFIYSLFFHLCAISFSQSALSYFRTGKVKCVVKDFHGAIFDLDKVLELDPKFDEKTELFYFRGQAKIGVNDYEGAITDLSMAISKEKDIPIYYFYRAEAKANLGLFEEALEDISIAIKLNPENSKYTAKRASIKFDMKDFEGAIQDYTQILIKEPKAEVYYNKALAECGLKNFENAIEDLNKAIALNSNDSDFYFHRGFAKYQTGNKIDACIDFNKAKILGNITNLEILSIKCE